MRLIDADALITQIEAEAEQMEDKILKLMFYAAINDVWQQPTIEPEPQWIPCSERLPVKYGTCLVTTRSGNIEFRCYSLLSGWTFDKKNVIAWMPLPEPYKGEKENEDDTSAKAGDR